MTPDQRTVLVVGPSWVGDMVQAQLFFRALLDGGDVAAVDVVAPPGSFPILERIPEVREAFLLSVDHGTLGLGTRWRLARRLRRRGYDQAYVLPSSLKSSLVPAMAGIPVRTAYRGELRYGLVNDVRRFVPQPTDRNVRGYLGLLGAADVEPLSEPRLRVDLERRRALVARLGLEPVGRIVALAPGAAAGPAKRWPVEKFRELAGRLSELGRTVWILSGLEDADLGEEIVRRSRAAVRNLCGRTSLAEAVDLLSLAEVTVANDSGLAHVAGAVGSPLVALFGPTTPDHSAPLNARSEPLYLGLECSPCFRGSCPLGHHRCLRDIPVEEVLRRVIEHSSCREADPESDVP